MPNTVQTSTFDDDDDDSFVARIPHPESEEHELREFLNEVPVEALTKSASDFFDSLEERHRLMLAQHYCADDAGADVDAVQGRERLSLPGAETRCHGRQGIKNFLGYEHSLIGKWMGSLGVMPRPDNLGIVHFLLKMLCFHAH